MAPILVTGGTGTLGREVVVRLADAGRGVRVLSRRPRPASESSGHEWAQGDLRRGGGLDQALAATDTVVHCATAPGGDAAAARHLIEAARRAGTGHLVYISIVGVDRVPLGYYRAKLEVEHLLDASGLGVTVLRTTQFHDLIARACRALSRLPAMVVPARTSFQPISVDEVAERLVELAGAAPAGRVPDMGGPEILATTQLARAYLRATGKRRPVLALGLPGKTAAGYRSGGHLAPEQAVGRVGFEEFLTTTANAVPLAAEDGK
jgi:uncharacterized protein YbjT (DUF2867 family)